MESELSDDCNDGGATYDKYKGKEHFQVLNPQPLIYAWSCHNKQKK